MPFGEHTLFSSRKVFLVKTRFAVFCLAKRKAILVQTRITEDENYCYFFKVNAIESYAILVFP